MRRGVPLPISQYGVLGPYRPHRGKIARLAVTGNLGALPYSVESSELRQLAHQLLVTTSAAGADYIALNGDNYVTFHNETDLARPLTPVDVIAATAGMIARAQPVILLFYSLLSIPCRHDAEDGAAISSSAR